MLAGKSMIIELRTKRRWIVSVLAAVAEATEMRRPAYASVKQPATRRMVPGEKGFAMRLKAATRPVHEAAR